MGSGWGQERHMAVVELVLQCLLCRNKVILFNNGVEERERT